MAIATRSTHSEFKRPCFVVPRPPMIAVQSPPLPFHASPISRDLLSRVCGRAIGLRSLDNIRDKDGGEATILTQLSSQGNKDSPTTTVHSEPSSVIDDSKSTSRARNGRFRKSISARSRYTGMPWVHASPHDLWQVVPSNSHPTVQRPPFSPIQHSRRSVVSDVLPRARSPVPKAIGSERKHRLHMVDILPKRPQSDPPERPKQRTVPLPTPALPIHAPPIHAPPALPIHAPTPAAPTPTPALPIHAPPAAPTPALPIHAPIPTLPPAPALPIHAPTPTPALPVIHLPPAPAPQSQQELIQKYESISKFNTHRFRNGTKWNPVPRFSSGLNPARQALGEVLDAKGKDFIDGERWERVFVPGPRERMWNYFRKPQVLGSRSRSLCERSHSRSGSGSISVNSYLRGSDQKHCLGCKREGVRVRLLVVQLWRRSVWESVGANVDASVDASATASVDASAISASLDLDSDIDLRLRLGLEFLGSEFEFDEFDEEDEEDDEDEDEGKLVDVVLGTDQGQGKRFVMDFWDDDDSQHSDVPMDVDSDISGPGRLDEELMRAARMDVDGVEWVGGVPDSPRLKDLDDFEDM